MTHRYNLLEIDWLLLEESQVRARGRWIPRGSRISAIRADGRRYRSFSSNGEARTRSRRTPPQGCTLGSDAVFYRS